MITYLDTLVHEGVLTEWFEGSHGVRDQTYPDEAAEYKEMQDMYSAAAPYIFLYEAPYPVAFRKNAKGFVQTPIGYNIFEAAWLDI